MGAVLRNVSSKSNTTILSTLVPNRTQQQVLPPQPHVPAVLCESIIHDFMAIVWEKKFVWVTTDDAVFAGGDPMSYIECLLRHPNTSRIGFIRRARASNGAPSKVLGVAFYIQDTDVDVPVISAHTTTLLTSDSIITETSTFEKTPVSVCLPDENITKRPQKRPRKKAPVVFKTNQHIQDLLMMPCGDI